MIVKVCGIKYRENLLDLFDLAVDMVGFNFYADSVRYVDAIPDVKCSIHLVPPGLKKVGVFVNSTTDQIKKCIDEYQLDYVQLHGGESSQFVQSLTGVIKVIKVFHVDKNFDFTQLVNFDSCDYFLFDTPTKNFGGSGRKFNWEVLENYKGEIPFLLSGGIGPQDSESLLQLNHSAFAGIDINSKFEDAPALKDIKLISGFIQKLNKYESDLT